MFHFELVLQLMIKIENGHDGQIILGKNHPDRDLFSVVYPSKKNFFLDIKVFPRVSDF